MTRVFRIGRVAAASDQEAAARVYELYPHALRVVLMPSPEHKRPFEYLVELPEERSDGDGLEHDR